MVLFTFLNRYSWTDKWGSRITTYFVDPLNFGSIILLATEITAIGLIIFWNKISNYHKIAYALIICFGLYMVTYCGSRTGWLATPAIFYVLIKYYEIKNGEKRRGAIVTLAFILVSIIFIYQSPGYVQKFKMIIDEIIEYKFNEMNPDNSVTMRISFVRMGLYYFIENPIKGWGDLGWMAKMYSPELVNYASEFTREYAKNGFHNELVSNAVHFGIFGIIAAIGYLFIPLIISLYYFKKKNIKMKENIKISSLLVASVSLHFIFHSVATEVTNLIFLVSFFSLTISIGLGEILHEEISDLERDRLVKKGHIQQVNTSNKSE